MLRWALSVALLLTATITSAGAQTFEAVGTRAAGMGGAFVAVADDASAAYWNPAGFASGALFSLVLDRTRAEMKPAGALPAASRSGLFMALGAPALALSYYRVRTSAVDPLPSSTGAPASVFASTLVTHQTGATLVQSVAPGVAVGATLKLVRGIASSAVRPASERDSLLKDGGDVMARGSTRFDADLGVMAAFGRLKAGLTVRNATGPSFKTPGGEPLTLERQARAGVAVTPLAGWTVAADMDLLENAGPSGASATGSASRRFAVGTEGRVHRKAFVRTGFSANTTGDGAPAISAGASFAATGSVLLDVQVTGGSDKAQRGWGVSARVGY
jgi:hypothetical protein